MFFHNKNKSSNEMKKIFVEYEQYNDYKNKLICVLNYIVLNDNNIANKVMLIKCPLDLKGDEFNRIHNYILEDDFILLRDTPDTNPKMNIILYYLFKFNENNELLLLSTYTSSKNDNPNNYNVPLNQIMNAILNKNLSEYNLKQTTNETQNINRKYITISENELKKIRKMYCIM